MTQKECTVAGTISNSIREFNSPNVIGVVKSNRLRYAEHMIIGAEDLLQRTLFRAMLEG
jgi:hypothetical protein